MTGEFALKIWAEAQRTHRNGFRIEGQGCMLQVVLSPTTRHSRNLSIEALIFILCKDLYFTGILRQKAEIPGTLQNIF